MIRKIYHSIADKFAVIFPMSPLSKYGLVLLEILRLEDSLTVEELIKRACVSLSAQHAARVNGRQSDSAKVQDVVPEEGFSKKRRKIIRRQLRDELASDGDLFAKKLVHLLMDGCVAITLKGASELGLAQAKNDSSAKRKRKGREQSATKTPGASSQSSQSSQKLPPTSPLTSLSSLPKESVAKIPSKRRGGLRLIFSAKVTDTSEAPVGAGAELPGKTPVPTPEAPSVATAPTAATEALAFALPDLPSSGRLALLDVAAAFFSSDPVRFFAAVIAALWRPRRIILGTVLLLALGLVSVAYWEVRTSTIQSQLIHEFAKKITFAVAKGPSDAIRFLQDGPLDQRLGYSRLPAFLKRLTTNGYHVAEQARLSPTHLQVIDQGLFPIYHEKTVAGLKVLDASGKLLSNEAFPRQAYNNFADVPAVVAVTLLFIENRELLDERFPKRNPAIEWERLSKASYDLFMDRFFHDRDVPGGSTLATQMEKYRHSLEGRTSTAKDKVRQMGSAMLRAYLDGQDTTEVRRRLLVDYINSVPLGAVASVGEVLGLADGLKAWYDLDFDTVNALLRRVPVKVARREDSAASLLDELIVRVGRLGQPDQHGLLGIFDDEAAATRNEVALPPLTVTEVVAAARAYRGILSLFLSQRRPAYYLQQDEGALKELTDQYLVLMEREGVIPRDLRLAAETAVLPIVHSDVQLAKPDYLGRKASNSVRIELGHLLGEKKLYSLDRLDLTVSSSFDAAAQRAVSELLQRAKDPVFAEAAGLTGFRLLEKEHVADVIYSFTLLERVGERNVLRVQTDSIDGPLNMNEGGKLELGSTAKLRTLISYLDILSELYDQYQLLPPEQLKVSLAAAQAAKDVLGAWVCSYLLTPPALSFGPPPLSPSLTAMLAASMDRTYSANPNFSFVTGGGLMKFANFDPKDNSRTMTIAEALTHSVNLVFVRLMKDVIDHLTVTRVPDYQKILADSSDPRRLVYLKKFAAHEGLEFLTRFYRRHHGETYDQALGGILATPNITPRRLAAALKTIDPGITYEAFDKIMKKKYEGRLSERDSTALFATLSVEAMSLRDRGYVARIHPLELRVIAMMKLHPGASLAVVAAACQADSDGVYSWLFESKNRVRQNKSIRSMLESDAFAVLHGYWKKVGFPFRSLVPSYATALGSSGDRPAALAELMGIIVGGGIRRPSTRIDEMQFATDTPFETRLSLNRSEPRSVLRPEITEVAKAALVNVVQNGTAGRVKGAFKRADLSEMVVGAKTGTGDNRYEVYAPGGRLVSSKAISRTATLVFFIGKRFFGTLTAFVPNEQADDFKFTSGLPAQLLKTLAPTLAPMIERAEAAEAARAGTPLANQGPATLPSPLAPSAHPVLPMPLAGPSEVHPEAMRGAVTRAGNRRPLTVPFPAKIAGKWPFRGPLNPVQ